MSGYYHLTYKNGGVATTEADSPEHAKEILLEAWEQEALTVSPIPYPQGGELRNPSKCPSFCYGGAQCVGKTSCPKSPSCCN